MFGLPALPVWQIELCVGPTIRAVMHATRKKKVATFVEVLPFLRRVLFAGS